MAIANGNPPLRCGVNPPPTDDDSPAFLTKYDVAALLNMSESTVKRLTKEGALRVAMRGAGPRPALYLREEVLDYRDAIEDELYGNYPRPRPPRRNRRAVTSHHRG